MSVSGILIGTLVLLAQACAEKRSKVSVSSIELVPGSTTFDKYEERGGPAISESERDMCLNLTLQTTSDGILFANWEVSWRVACACCQLKGLTLLSKPLKHPKGISVFKQPIYVGANDILEEHYYEWITGEVIRYGSSEFKRGDPTDKIGKENCCPCNQRGKIWDGVCSVPLKFLCEAPPPPEGETPSVEEQKVCGKIEYANIGSQFHLARNYLTYDDGLNQPLARMCCSRNGWQLASLGDISIEDENALAKEIVGNQSYWVDGTNLKTGSKFMWGSEGGEVLPSFRLWDKNSPQQLFTGRNCTQISTMGSRTLRMRDVSCNLKLGLLCQTPQTKETKPKSCCTGADSMITVTTPGSYVFQFVPETTLLSKLELGLSLLKDLSPSKTTGLNWVTVWKKYYLDVAGKGPVAFPNTALPPNLPKEHCVTMAYFWPRYTAICGNASVVFTGDAKVISAKNLTAFCSNKTVTCLNVSCKASDKWNLLTTAHYVERKGRRAKIGVKSAETKSCFTFKPSTEGDNLLSILLEQELVTQLNPSSWTGVDWEQYYKNKTTGIELEDYSIKGNELPENHFINVYNLVGYCGKYTTTVPIFKKVVFLEGDVAGNCEIAKKQNVPLEHPCT